MSRASRVAATLLAVGLLSGCALLDSGPKDAAPTSVTASDVSEGYALLYEVVAKHDTASDRLRVDGLPDGTWLGWFGMHLLAPGIFDILEEMIRDDIRDNGEFQLTRAQEIQRQREGYLALEITGAQRFDFGVPDDFVRSLQAFRAF